MNNFIESRANMTEAEWKLYESHLAKRAKEEQQRIEYQRQRNIQLRKLEIERIMKSCGGRFTREELERYSLDTLMMIF